MRAVLLFSGIFRSMYESDFFKSAVQVLTAFFLLIMPEAAGTVSIKALPGADRMTYLSALSFDHGQRVRITGNYLSEDGAYGIVEFDGCAEGHKDNSLAGTLNIWLYVGAPEGSRIRQDNPLPGWNIMLFLTHGQTPEQTARMLADRINSADDRPYYAKVFCHKVFIYYRSYFEDTEARKAVKKAAVMRKISRSRRIKNADTAQEIQKTMRVYSFF